MRIFFPALGLALVFLASVTASAQGVTKHIAASAQQVTSYGVIEFTYVKQDGVRITERRNVDMDAYVASAGYDIAPIQLIQASICDPVELPVVPVFPPAAPPPSPLAFPPSTGMVVIFQFPAVGGGEWYQSVQYSRTVYPNSDGTWDTPGEWGNPLVKQVHGQVPNAAGCETSSE